MQNGTSTTVIRHILQVREVHVYIFVCQNRLGENLLNLRFVQLLFSCLQNKDKLEFSREKIGLVVSFEHDGIFFKNWHPNLDFPPIIYEVFKQRTALRGEFTVFLYYLFEA